MLLRIIGWDNENAETRFFDVTDSVMNAIVAFVTTGAADDELMLSLGRLRTEEYDVISETPMGELDRHYRERLAAMYVWEEMQESEITPDWTLEFPQR